MTLQEFIHQNPDDRTIGKFIKALRKEKGMTQVELAEQLGCHHIIMAGIEHGDCEPSPRLLRSILDIFGLYSLEMQDIWVLDKDYRSYAKAKKIRQLILKSKFEKASKLLHKLEGKEIFKKGIYLQFVLSAKAYLMSKENISPLKVIEYTVKALNITFKNFEEKNILKRPLSHTEIVLINLLSIQYSKLEQFQNSINILLKLKKSIDKYIIDIEEKEKLYPSILKNLLTFLNDNKEHDKVLELGEYAIAYCIEIGENIEFAFILTEYACALYYTNNKALCKKYLIQAHQTFTNTCRIAEAKIVKSRAYHDFKISW